MLSAQDVRTRGFPVRDNGLAVGQQETPGAPLEAGAGKEGRYGEWGVPTSEEGVQRCSVDQEAVKDGVP